MGYQRGCSFGPVVTNIEVCPSQLLFHAWWTARDPEVLGRWVWKGNARLASQGTLLAGIARLLIHAAILGCVEFQDRYEDAVWIKSRVCRNAFLDRSKKVPLACSLG